MTSQIIFYDGDCLIIINFMLLLNMVANTLALTFYMQVRPQHHWISRCLPFAASFQLLNRLPQFATKCFRTVNLESYFLIISCFKWNASVHCETYLGKKRNCLHFDFFKKKDRSRNSGEHP